MLKSWKRCWCVIDGGRLIVHRLGASGEAAAQQKWRDKPLAERTANPNPNPNPSSNPNPSLGQERTACNPSPSPAATPTLTFTQP